MGKRLVIDQKLCDKVMKMRNSGMDTKSIAEILEISRTTISRIEEVYYDANRYKEACEQRQAEEKIKKKQGQGPNPHVKIWDDNKTGGVDYSDVVQGQMKMELPEEKTPHDYEEAVRMFMPEGGGQPVQIIDVNKMMRFQAGQVEKICALLIRIDDRLAQLLRRTDG